jgi:putative transposase
VDLVTQAQRSGANKSAACELLGVSLRTVERWENNPSDLRKGPLTMPQRTLTEPERLAIIKTINSVEYSHLPPGQIVPTLADKGIYLASESSFYRIMRAESLLTHRLKSKPRAHAKPEELMAKNPNEIWSWDITYLKTYVKGMFYYLYLPMDIFSRFIVHWEVHDVESMELSSQMIRAACEKENIERDQITLHADNGSPMKGATMTATLHWLGITPSFSRPRVSDDNPFSESLFKTLKYCPSFPDNGFATLEDARAWTKKFVNWYNNQHLHSGINWVTPSARHHGNDIEILKKRSELYEETKKVFPNRWTGDTRNWQRTELVELNPGKPNRKSKTHLCQQAS